MARTETSITFAPTAKTSRNRTTFHKEFILMILDSFYFMSSHRSNQGKRSRAKCRLNIHGHPPQVFHYIEEEINKRRKKEIPHSIFFYHHNFSIFFREMPANN